MKTTNWTLTMLLALPGLFSCGGPGGPSPEDVIRSATIMVGPDESAPLLQLTTAFRPTEDWSLMAAFSVHHPAVDRPVGALFIDSATGEASAVVDVAAALGVGHEGTSDRDGGRLPNGDRAPSCNGWPRDVRVTSLSVRNLDEGAVAGALDSSRVYLVQDAGTSKVISMGYALSIGAVLPGFTAAPGVRVSMANFEWETPFTAGGGDGDPLTGCLKFYWGTAPPNGVAVFVDLAAPLAVELTGDGA